MELGTRTWQCYDKALNFQSSKGRINAWRGCSQDKTAMVFIHGWREEEVGGVSSAMVDCFAYPMVACGDGQALSLEDVWRWRGCAWAPASNQDEKELVCFLSPGLGLPSHVPIVPIVLIWLFRSILSWMRSFPNLYPPLLVYNRSTIFYFLFISSWTPRHALIIIVGNRWNMRFWNA